MKGVVVLCLALVLVMVAGETAKVSSDVPYATRDVPYATRDVPYATRERPYLRRERPPYVRRERPSYVREEEPYVRKEEPYVRKEEPYVRKEEPHPHVTSYPALEELNTLVDGLEEDLGGIGQGLAEAATVCAIADEQLNQISGFFIPKSKLIIQQQNEVITDFKAQAKALRKEVDVAKADISAAMVLAESTHAELQRQISDYLNGSKVGDLNNAQSEQLAQLREDLAQEKSSFLSGLLNLTVDLLSLHVKAGEKIKRLDRFVDSRRCETGFISVGLNQSTTVYFQTPFSRDPNVTLTLSGFSSDLHVYSQGERNELAVKKEVTAVYPNYFVLEVQDLSQGKVRGIYAGCRWVACQNIEGTFLNLHEDNEGSHGSDDDGGEGGDGGDDGGEGGDDGIPQN